MPFTPTSSSRPGRINNSQNCTYLSNLPILPILAKSRNLTKFEKSLICAKIPDLTKIEKMWIWSVMLFWPRREQHEAVFCPKSTGPFGPEAQGTSSSRAGSKLSSRHSQVYDLLVTRPLSVKKEEAARTAALLDVGTSKPLACLSLLYLA